MWLVMALVACGPEAVLTVDPETSEITIRDVLHACEPGPRANERTMCVVVPATVTSPVDGEVIGLGSITNDGAFWVASPFGPHEVFADTPRQLPVQGCVHCDPGMPMPESGEYAGELVWMIADQTAVSEVVVTVERDEE